MVNPAMQLSSKIPDTHVQLWASAILKGEAIISVLLTTFIFVKLPFYLDLHRMDNNPQHEEEGSRMHKNFSQTLLQDHFRASQLQEHNLIEWTDGPFPALPPASVNTTSVPRSS